MSLKKIDMPAILDEDLPEGFDPDTLDADEGEDDE